MAIECANEISTYRSSAARNDPETPSNGEVTDELAGANMRYSYYAWYTYDLITERDIVTVRTPRLNYYTGSTTGVRPSAVQLALLQVELFNAVVRAAAEHRVPYPGNEAVLNTAILHTSRQPDM